LGVWRKRRYAIDESFIGLDGVRSQPCIELDDAPAPKKEIACTRSFGRPVTSLAPLIEAVNEFASGAAEKLRRQSSLAGQLLVFAHTSPFWPGPRFSRSTVVVGLGA